MKAQEECRYTSPIDDKPITTWAQRLDDLDRHNCQPYDPEMKTDYHQRQKDSDASLDKAVEESVEEAIAKMPTKQRGQLHKELVEMGTDLTYHRSTKGA